MKQKTTKWVNSTLLAALTLLLNFFSFNAKAQQEAFAVPKDTLYVINRALTPSQSYQTRYFTVPAGVTELRIQCWGAGAAGAYVEAYPRFGAGGGGGAYARKNVVPVTPGDVLTIEIGAGGLTDKNGRGAGGNTTVKKSDGTILVKAAGAPGLEVNQKDKGLGGKIKDCIGDVRCAGGNGGAGMDCIVGGYAGAGGGAAGNEGSGGNGEAAGWWSQPQPGEPGTSSTTISGSSIPGKGGYGGGLVTKWFGDNGEDGNNYGAGGGGGIGGFTNPYHGGAGANGAVLITYDDCSATAGSIKQEVTLCSKQLVNEVSAKGAPGTYFWEMSKDNTIWTVIPGATNDNFTPSDTAYYRRGYTTRCGNSVRTDPVHVQVGFPAAGFVALTTSPATTSLTVCKYSTPTISLSMYSSTVAQVKWQKSINQGAGWSDMGAFQPVGDAKVISEPNVQVETWYRAVYEPSTGCEVPTSNQFVLKVEDGVIGRPDFWFDTTTVNITLRYGDSDTTPYISEPKYEPRGSVVLTNNKSVLNEGRLLGTQGPGTYTIDWTLTDCGEPKTYTKKYVISYPDCNELLSTRDFDGNQYNSVRIGVNCWTKENLRSLHYNNSDTIRGNYVYESAQYPDTAANLATFGRLYTWYAAVGIPEGSDDVPATNIFGHIVGVCPQGWFLPNAPLMSELNDYLSKDLRTTNLWVEEEGTNITGMSAKPAGCRNGENSRFEDLHISSYFWTSQEVISEKSYAYWIDCHCSITQLKEFSKHDALSIRCVKENEETLPTVIEFQPAQLSYSEARLFGDVIDCGGLPILERGFCYNTTPMPELNDGSSLSVQNSVPAVGPYNNDINGLSIGTVYYVRAYAKNALGTAYSEQKIFSLTNMPDTITFHANGGSSSMDLQLVARGVSTPLSKCLFTYPLSTFKGWSTTPTGAVEYADQANITTSGNVDLYALWYVPTHTATTEVACGSYTWTSGNGETYTTSGTKFYQHYDEHGCTQVDTLYLTINPTFKDTKVESVLLGPGQSYQYRGKYYDETGTYLVDSYTTVCCGCDSSYYLDLTVNTPSIDTVYFNANGGENTMTPQVFTRNIAQQLKANTFTYPLSVFKCWNTQPYGTGTDYTNQQTITTTGSMTLYAQWYHPQHKSTTVTECDRYTWVGGTGTTYTKSGTYNYQHTDEHGCTQVDTLHLTIYKGFSNTETASISASYTPYEWIGHNKSYNVGGTYYDSLITIHNCDSVYTLILTVTDSVKKTITFYKNDATSTMTTQMVNINMPTALNPNTFTNNYLRFDSWNTQPTGSGTTYTDRQVVTLTENLTLYAQWSSYCDGTPRSNESGNGRVDSVKDHQNNWYEVVQIGTQCWLKENMRATSSPSTGSNILLDEMVSNNRSKAACYYDDKPKYHNVYGVMYNWCAMMDVYKSGSSEVASDDDKNPFNNPGVSTNNHRGICPEGWHIPTDAEWNTMTSYAGVSVSTSTSSSGKNGVGKLAGDGWESYYGGAENGYPGNMDYTYHNSTGFTALPGGFYCRYSYGFDSREVCTHFWVARSNDAEVRCIYYGYKHLFIENEDGDGTNVYKRDASYVRCVRN